MTATPEGCRYCGAARRDHGRRWHPEGGVHGWTEPTRDQLHARIRAKHETTDSEGDTR